MFVLPLHFGHREQAVDQFRPAAFAGITRGGFVFDDVSTFKPARAVHGRKPAGDVTQKSERAADDGASQFTSLVWTSTQTGEHLAD